MYAGDSPSLRGGTGNKNRMSDPDNLLKVYTYLFHKFLFPIKMGRVHIFEA